ncbi:MAG: TylF/MycF/NovP-related O-methyltransferase, partial [bacterium]
VSALYPRIPGYVLEFGVASVYTINMLAGFFREKTIYGFDSFDGLPEDWVKNPGRIDFPKGFFKGSLPEVRHNVVLISGLFQNVLPTWLKKNPDAVSYLHIDSDLYSSARYVLNVLNDRIKPGTVVVFNELCRWDEKTSDGFKGEYANWQEGEWKALKEWMIENNRTIKILCRDNAESAVIVVCK